MSGFEKIELGDTKKIKKEESLFMSVKRRQPPPIILKGFLLFIAFLLVIGIITAFPAYATYNSAKKAYAKVKVVSDAMKQQNIALASEELQKTKVELTETRKHFNKMFYLKYIPIANLYYNDADHMLKAGEHGMQTSEIVISSIQPYADVLGLKGQGSFAAGSAEDRIKTAVMTMGKITPEIDKIADSLLLIRKEIDGVNPNHYPEFIFGTKPKTQLTQVRDLTDQGVTLVNEARPLIKVLPSLLGESEEKRYLVLFQNDKELRATGGFLTAYSIVKIDKGRITVEKTDDIYPLDDSVPNKPAAPDAFKKYLEVSRLNLRDSNISPDFVVSMNTFEEMYNRSSQKTNIDGIVAIDTNVLTSTIKILDDQIEVAGYTFTTKNDPRCDCPQVIYELEDNISRPVAYVKDDRKGLLGKMMNAIMVKALSSSPKVYWGPLFQSMIMLTNQKHILFNLYDTEAQKGIEAMNAAGRIEAFDGDYLHISDVNLGGQKSNLFTTHTVEVAYEKQSDSTIKKTLTLTYKNTFPPSNCDLEAGQLCLNAPLRNWLRIYVPKGSTLVESKGSQVKLLTYDELDKTVFEGFLTVRPLGQAKFEISYTLPFKLTQGSPLPILIQKQPGTFGHDYTLTANGKLIEEFKLFADKEMQLKM